MSAVHDRRRLVPIPRARSVTREQRVAARPVHAPQIAVLGMMSTIPVPGVVYQTMHYLIGLQRLGFDVFYIEDNGTTPRAFFGSAEQDGWALAATWLKRVMHDFGLSTRWAMRARFSGDRCFGMSRGDLARLFQEAALIINLHGGTEPREEHAATGRLVYLETDPVEVEVQLSQGNARTGEYLSAHAAWFTFGENIGMSGCALSGDPRFPMWPTRQPVVLDLWDASQSMPRPVFTTVGNLRQPHRQVQIDGETYHWSKHLEFERLLDLPARTSARFELALASVDDEDRRRFTECGWHLRPPFLEYEQRIAYHDFIVGSGAEFTVAKDQNVRLRTAWFSDRSATYLAAGRPVITQDTGFGAVLPTGEGLLPYSDCEAAASAVDAVLSDPARHRRAAASIAHDYFASEVVLGELLGRLDLLRPSRPTTPGRPSIPSDLPVRAVSMWPTTLPELTAAVARRRRHELVSTVRSVSRRSAGVDPEVSVIVPVHDAPDFTMLCVDSILQDDAAPRMELILVDDGSATETAQLLDAIARNESRVVIVRQKGNCGFAAAVNAGMRRARGRAIVLLNSDTMVTPGWLVPLLAQLNTDVPALVGAVTNRACNEAEVQAPYQTFGELVDHALQLRRSRPGRSFEVEMLAMFCVAGHRETFEKVGLLDEGYGLGMFEDDDFAQRARRQGIRLQCAEDVFVHHFGQATLSARLDGDEYQALFSANRARYESRWGEWREHRRRENREYVELIDRVRDAVDECVPRGATVLVISKGDEELVRLPGRVGRHFPCHPDGGFTGEYPLDSATAIEILERERLAGAGFLVVPAPATWWLTHYAGMAAHLEASAAELVRKGEDCLVWALEPSRASDIADLRRLVASQADVLARAREELAALRRVVVDRERMEDDGSQVVTPEPLRETYEVLGRLVTELGASKDTQYTVQRARLRMEIGARVPMGSTIAVVSRGDDRLVDLPGHTGWHLPRVAGGAWGGFHPHDDASALLWLELLRSMGADHLVLPAMHSWWLTHYPGLADHLSAAATTVFADPNVGWIWSLAPVVSTDTTISIEAVLTAARQRGPRDVAVLDWDTGMDLAGRLPEVTVFSPPVETDVLPYLDATVDLVVVIDPDDRRAREASRVASLGVVTAAAPGAGLTVTWQSDVGRTALPRASIVCPGPDDAQLAALTAASHGCDIAEVLMPDHASCDVIGLDMTVPLITVPGDAGQWMRSACAAASGDVVVVVDVGALPLAGSVTALIRALDQTGVHAACAVAPDAADLAHGMVTERDGVGIGSAVAATRAVLQAILGSTSVAVHSAADLVSLAEDADINVLAHRAAVAMPPGSVPW